jgi:dolichol-phosphate mannosyltransferase
MEAAIAAPASSMPGLARRALKFLTVGASGLVVNQGLLQLLHGGLGWPLAGASVVAVECSILTNFTLNSLWTWRDQATPGARNWIRRGLQYHVVTLAAMVTNVVGVVVLSKRFGMDYRVANVLAIAAGSLATYLVSDRWVFRKLR